MEQTLFICKEVDVYTIPPRTGRGHISGEWLVESKIATCRCKVLALPANQLEVRLEDASSGEIFGSCPVPRGHKEAAVEAAVDSSRNFVLRLVDPNSGRHAFVGMNFAERSNAFDFNVALTDYEKRLQREEDLKAAAAAAATTTTTTTSKPSSPAVDHLIPEAAILYQKHDFSLKEGEQIRVEVKKSNRETSSTSPSGGFGGSGGGGGGGGDTGGRISDWTDGRISNETDGRDGDGRVLAGAAC